MQKFNKKMVPSNGKQYITNGWPLLYFNGNRSNCFFYIKMDNSLLQSFKVCTSDPYNHTHTHTHIENLRANMKQKVPDPNKAEHCWYFA